MEQLFDEIEARMLQSPALSDERERVLAIIASAGESGELHAHSHSADGKVRVSAKPVVRSILLRGDCASRPSKPMPCDDAGDRRRAAHSSGLSGARAAAPGGGPGPPQPGQVIALSTYIISTPTNQPTKLLSFEEALKFLEAASIQLTDIEFRSRDSRKAEPGRQRAC